jgi:hypothetical protein
VIDGYLAAGLTGSLYVLWKAGLPGFLAASLPHIVGTVVAATGVTSIDPVGADDRDHPQDPSKAWLDHRRLCLTRSTRRRVAGFL